MSEPRKEMLTRKQWTDDVWLGSADEIDLHRLDAHDAAQRAEIERLNEELRCVGNIRDSWREQSRKHNIDRIALAEQVRTLREALERHLRFYAALADECEKAGTDYERGRSYGIRNLHADIRAALSASPAPAVCKTCLGTKQVQGPPYGSGQSDTFPCPDCASTPADREKP